MERGQPVDFGWMRLSPPGPVPPAELPGLAAEIDGEAAEARRRFGLPPADTAAAADAGEQ